MLTQIQVRNFTIVDELDLDLCEGMTVLTGETGAGKSILLDALMLALGTRADIQTIRHGCDRADVTAEFDLSNLPNVTRWLKDQEIDVDNSCFIRRTINLEGRSKGFINGLPVAMQTLRNLGVFLVDIHGQHAFQSLLKKEYQRQALDNFAGHEDLVTAVNKYYKQWKKLDSERATLHKNQTERESRLELLDYQTLELNDLALESNEIQPLEEELHRLSNLTKILETGKLVSFALDNDDASSINSQLSALIRQLEEIRQFDTGLANVTSMITESAVTIKEAASELSHYLDVMDTDPQRLESVNERLSLIHDLARKHHCHPQDLAELSERLQAELNALRTTEQQSSSMDTLIVEAETQYRQSATKLTKQRQSAAKLLSKAIGKNMRLLGMKSGIFEAVLVETDGLSPHGLEKIEFCVSTNPGHPLQALSKVASGGELSRISLAIQVITASKTSVPTLIFDEVDVGIGGGTAEVVGKLLKKLSINKQILCVTHQPQVAALAHHHLHVNKLSTKNSTKTNIVTLENEQKTDEIARMLGGINITEQTLSHAREMISHSELETSDEG